MLEFFQSIGDWFVANKTAILITLSGVDFGALVTLLGYFFKQRKSIDANTQSTNELNLLLKANEQHNKDMEELKAENHDLKLQVESMKTNEEILLAKLNAMLDVQSLVYATIKDEPTRVAVGNILANAKYSETNTRNKLKNDLNTLKEKVAEQVKSLNETVENVVEDVESTVDNSKPIALRY